MTAREWNHRLVMAGSESRAGVLVEACATTPSKTAKRKLLREWFNSCDALAPWRDELREQFLLAGFVTDTKERPELPTTIYRAAWEDDEPELALSWTTDLAIAERFCKGLTGMRAEFLGIRRTDVDAYIFQGTCIEMLGYLEGRGESEVIPAAVEDVEPIAKLVTVSSDPA